MNFKTKLWVLFITIISLPVILTAVTFSVLSYRVIQKEGMNYGIKVENFTMWSDSLTSFEELTDEIFYRLQIQVAMDSSRFLDKKYLMQVNEGLMGTSSYIIVRKDNEIYFSGNDVATRQIQHRLPEYGGIHEGVNAGYYYSDMQKLVKQIDFTFPAGEKGSIFIVTKVSSVISKDLLAYLFVFIVSILL